MALMGEFNKNRRLAFLPSGNNLYLHFLVFLHWIIVLANLGAMVLIPVLCLMGQVPWYYAFPIVTFLSQLACTRFNCPFTNYENKKTDRFNDYIDRFSVSVSGSNMMNTVSSEYEAV